MNDADEEHRKLFCGNLDQRVTEELLYELFIQAGPLESVNMPLDRNGSPSQFAFIVFKHECSVPYALELFENTTLYGKHPKLRARRGVDHHRTQSAPAHFNQNNRGYDQDPNAQVGFDQLLRMSRDKMNPPPMHGQYMGGPVHMGGTPYMGGPPYMGGSPYMGAPPYNMGGSQYMGGSPYMGGPPPMGGSLMGMPPLMGGPYMGPPMGLGPPAQRQMQPLPPGEEVPDEPVDEDHNVRDLSQNSLSQSSLQGNWSTRNASHMLPPDDHRRQGQHQSRRDRQFNRDDRYSGRSGNGRHNEADHSKSPDRRDRRDRSDRSDHRGYRDDRGGYNRSRSDMRERKGRY